MVDLRGVLNRHAVVGLDTTVFIYHLEAVPRFAAPAALAIGELDRGSLKGVTSVLTFAELFVRPLQTGQPELAAAYEVRLRAIRQLDIVDIDTEVAWRAAALRAVHPLRTPDALQVAACIEHGATAFVTNDRRLRRLTEIEVVLLGDFQSG